MRCFCGVRGRLVTSLRPRLGGGGGGERRLPWAGSLRGQIGARAVRLVINRSPSHDPSPSITSAPASVRQQFSDQKSALIHQSGLFEFLGAAQTRLGVGCYSTKNKQVFVSFHGHRIDALLSETLNVDKEIVCGLKITTSEARVTCFVFPGLRT